MGRRPVGGPCSVGADRRNGPTASGRCAGVTGAGATRPTAARAATRRSGPACRTSSSWPAWTRRRGGAAALAHGVLAQGSGLDRGARPQRPAMSQQLLRGAMEEIRASTVLPARREADRAAHRRRADAGRRARAARGPAAGGDAGLPAPAADPRRHDGQPRAAQGVLPAARARRPRRAAVQHPRHDLATAAPARAPSTTATASASTSRRRWSSPSTTTCRAPGCSAGRSAPSWRSVGPRPAGRGRDPALAAAAPGHRRRPRRAGRRSAGR